MLDMNRSARFAVFGIAWITQSAAYAADSYMLTIKDHRFTPTELEIPAGQKIKLVVKNEDSTPEEFESKSLKREKIVAGNSQITLSIGPLDPGSYDFLGEFHEDSAKGRIIAK